MKKYFCYWLHSAQIIAVVFCLIAPVGFNDAAAQTTVAITTQQILDAHNVYRKELGIQPLTWSADLANFAQRWANELASNKDCRLAHRPQDNGSAWKQLYGENIYSGGGTSWAPTILDAIAGWGEEKDNFDFTTKNCKGSQSCGHYTQLVWRNTTAVGCAIAKCSNGNVIVVCNYNPGGNWVGEPAF